ncbi:MAG: TIGR01210 family radical SAM protein [Methanobacteriota archaeon]|nr:MAG: TIGR01210 family radical SAM protein [Euryarchaeota archaeon]
MIKNVEKPLAAWLGKERHNGEILDCLTVILRSGGCRHAACRMCGYRHERYEEGIAPEQLAGRIEAQIAWTLREFPTSGYRMVKIFTSGSFFDPCEVPPLARAAAARAFRGKLVIAETRPEYIDREVLLDFAAEVDDGSFATPVFVAVGLETTDDAIREKSIGKGFSYEDYRAAAREAHAAGCGVKAYLLHKPLFLTEGEALADMRRSIAEASSSAEIVSMNPCTVQSRTEVEWYWRRGAYRPPYLWSVLAILADAPVHVLCDPLGGGKARGPHNCGTCDREIVAGIRDYSLSADRELLRAILERGCNCTKEWEFVLGSERPFCMPLTR